jgi:hypothetical protein
LRYSRFHGIMPTITKITNELMCEILKQLQAGVADIKADEAARRAGSSTLGQRDKPQADVRDVKSRLSSIENYIATMHGDQERTGIKVDDVIARIERLEKCVGLVDAQ